MPEHRYQLRANFRNGGDGNNIQEWTAGILTGEDCSPGRTIPPDFAR